MKPTTATAGGARKETCKNLSANPATEAAETRPPQRRIAIATSRQWTRYTESRFKQFASGR